jgi:hypothetical protein
MYWGKSDPWAGSLAIQLTGIYKDDMLPWVLSIIFIPVIELSPYWDSNTGYCCQSFWRKL